MMRNPTQLISAGISLVIFIAAFIAPIYLFMQINSAKAHVSEVQSSLLAQAELERTESLTKQALIDTKQEREQLDALALGSDKAAIFISAIEAEGKSAGVKLELGNVAVNPKEGLFNELSLNLQASGGFSDTFRFLKLVETLPYASTVRSVLIERKDEKSALWILTLSISVPIHK